MDIMYNIIMYMLGTYAIVVGIGSMIAIAYETIKCIKSPRVDRRVDCRCRCGKEAD